MSDDRPLSLADAALADCLGRVVAELRAEWRKEMLAVAAEARATIAEVKAAAAEALLEKHDSQAAAKLKSITGGRS